MSRKEFLKIILLNFLWVLWLALSVLFGYLLVKTYFPQTKVLLIAFSAGFIVAGGCIAFCVHKITKKLKNSGRDKQPEDEKEDD